jgi:hypothetical protein
MYGDYYHMPNYSLSAIRATIILWRREKKCQQQHKRKTLLGSRDAPVKVEEEGKKVEAQLKECFFFVATQSPEDFGRVVHVALFSDPVKQYSHKHMVLREPYKLGTQTRGCKGRHGTRARLTCQRCRSPEGG